MNEWKQLDDYVVTLQTEKGRFILTKSTAPTYPGIFIDYQEPGKPVQNLALIEHMLEEDVLRTVSWEHCIGDFEPTHETIYHRPESDILQEVLQQIKAINQTHSGLELDARLGENNVLELGYWDLACNFNPLKKIPVDGCNPEDLNYCATSQGWKFVRE